MNITDRVAAKMLETCSNAQEGWIALVSHFDKSDRPIKIECLQKGYAMGLTEGDDPEIIFGKFHDLGLRSRTAFGESIQAEDLFELLLLSRISGYDFQVQTAKLNRKIDFESLESSIKLESETRKVSQDAKLTLRTQPLAKQAVGMSPCGHSANKFLENQCRECHPCNLCVESKERYTYHVPRSARCFNKDKPHANFASVTKITMVADSGDTRYDMDNPCSGAAVWSKQYTKFSNLLRFLVGIFL
jgi:hypothetical protein